jgi:hypothetical protein
MEEPRDVVQSRLEALCRAVGELERRVAQLEKGAGAEPTVMQQEQPELSATAGPGGDLAAEITGGMVPLFGWALLGIAGAYLLRALTESGAIPGSLAAVMGIIYAGLWMFLAAQKAWDKPLISVVHGLTAALILVPMLLEMTVRFHLLSLPFASSAAVLFAALGLVIGWRHNITPIAWIATLAGLVTAIGLFRETHDAATLTITALVIAAAVEFSACRDHWLSLRWVAAMAADLLVLMLSAFAARPHETAVVGVESVGVVFGTQVALLVIYLSSTVSRTILRGLSITWFEIGQVAASAAISIGCALRLAEKAPTMAYGVGVFCLAAGLACYALSFVFLDRASGKNRNFYAYSTFALPLIVAGFSVLLSGTTLVAACSTMAVTSIWTGFMQDRDTLRIHSAVYLILGVALSGLVPDAMNRLVRSGEVVAPPVTAGYLLVLAGAFLCYAAILTTGKAMKWGDVVGAVVAAGLVLVGSMGWISGLIEGMAPARTALITALAICAGWAGARWKRPELVRLAYPLLGLGGYKLVMEDLKGQSLMLFMSLILVGGGLILLPRLLREKQDRFA